MVDFSKPATILAVVIIGLFAISMFAVLLSVPGQDGQDGTPTPLASATPEAGFEGGGNAQARVVSLSDQLLVQCSASNSQALASLLQNQSFASSAFEISDGLYALTLENSTVALKDGTASDALLELKIALSPYCVPRVLRKAAVEFSEPVVLADASGGNKTVFPREISAFALLAGSPDGAPAYVLSAAAPNSTVQLLVNAAFAQEKLSQWFVQQLPSDLPRLVTLPMAVGVQELLLGAFGQLDIAWQARGLNTLPLQAQLNSSKLFNASSLEYSPDNSVALQGVAQENLQAYAAVFRNQSFVSEVLEREGTLVLFVAENYTDASGLAKVVSDNKLNGTLVFSNSTLAVSVSYANSTTSFQQAADELKLVLGVEAIVLREAVLASVERETQSRVMKAAMPLAFPGRVLPDSVQGDLKLLEVRMLVQDEVVVRAEARETAPLG